MKPYLKCAFSFKEKTRELSLLKNHKNVKSKYLKEMPVKATLTHNSLHTVINKFTIVK